MRLLLAGSVFRPEWTGGEPWTARALATGFMARGHEIIVDAGAYDAFSLIAMASSPADWDLVRSDHYRHRIRESRPDVVVGFYDYDSSLCRASTRLGVPYVSVVHIYWPLCPIGTCYIDGVGPCDRPGFSKCLRHMSQGVPETRLPLGLRSLPPPLGVSAYLKLRARKATLREARAIIVLSEKMVSMMRRAGYDRVVAIPSGVDLTEVRSAPWPEARPRTLFLPSTSQSERKGTAHFVAAARRLKARRSDVRFVATNYPTDATVEGTPFLTRSELMQRYAASYAVVAPVLWDEPFGLVAIEAMGTGRPVVAYDAGALPELVKDGETGIIVPRGDQAGLADAIERLLDDEALARRMGAAGRRRVEQFYTKDRMVDDYLRTIDSVRTRSG